MKRQFLLIVFTFLLVVPGRATDAGEQLDALFSELETWMNRHGNYHIQYSMKLSGEREGKVSDTIVINYYSRGEDKYMVMGDRQEMIYLKGLLLTVNHDMRYVSAVQDTADLMGNQGTYLIKELTNEMDSVEVRYDKSCKHKRCFSVVFKDHAQYKQMELSFTGKDSPQLQHIKLWMKPNKKGLETMELAYTEWNTDWTPDDEFPRLSDYIRAGQQEGTYLLQDKWSDYQYYQPEILPER